MANPTFASLQSLDSISSIAKSLAVLASGQNPDGTSYNPNLIASTSNALIGFTNTNGGAVITVSSGRTWVGQVTVSGSNFNSSSSTNVPVTVSWGGTSIVGVNVTSSTSLTAPVTGTASIPFTAIANSSATALILNTNGAVGGSGSAAGFLLST